MFLHPEIKLAKRLVAKYKLVPPINLDALVKKYASVEELALPVDADGISINLKVSGKKTHIIINQSIAHKRKRFTLAHELGHVIIPWHFGTIMDVTDINYEHDSYTIMEAEANRFAAELLMPEDWLNGLLAELGNPEEMVRKVTEEADVSSLAATIKILNALPAGYIYANIAHNGEVLSSGRSEGTIANPPEWHKIVDPEDIFPFCKVHQNFILDGNNYHWWVLSSDVNVPSSSYDDRSWEEILNLILEDMKLSGLEAKKFVQSLNGYIGYANSRVRGNDRTVEAIYSACLQRFHSKDELRTFIEHPDFDEFLIKKATALMQGKQS